MRTLYISETGRILLDENNTPHAVNHSREAVNNVFFLKEDTTVIYSKNGESKTINAKAGDIVVSFYEEKFPNKIIVVNNNEWKENIEAYDAWEQKRKEEWAKNHSENPNCCECDCDCKAVCGEI